MNPRRSSRLARILALVLAYAVLSSAHAHAHAGFSGGEPTAGSNLPDSPEQVRLTFTEPVEAEFDPLRVTGPGGERVDAGDARVSSDDARVVEVGLRDLSEGTYTVKYRVTSVDGHVISGGYEFTVAPPAEETTAPAIEETTPEPTQEPSVGPTRETLPETETASRPSGSFGTYAIVGLVVVGLTALTVAFMRDRGRS